MPRPLRCYVRLCGFFPTFLGLAWSQPWQRAGRRTARLQKHPPGSSTTRSRSRGGHLVAMGKRQQRTRAKMKGPCIRERKGSFILDRTEVRGGGHMPKGVHAGACSEPDAYLQQTGRLPHLLQLEAPAEPILASDQLSRLPAGIRRSAPGPASVCHRGRMGTCGPRRNQKGRTLPLGKRHSTEPKRGSNAAEEANAQQPSWPMGFPALAASV